MKFCYNDIETRTPVDGSSFEENFSSLALFFFLFFLSLSSLSVEIHVDEETAPRTTALIQTQR